MITIYTLKEIEELRNVSDAMKKELTGYFREIAEGIVEAEWKTYNLNEVGPILVIENNDTVNVLDEYGIMQRNQSIPQYIPEFAITINVDGINMLKIIWVCNDSFGLSVYYPVGKFGEEFDAYINQFLVE